MSRCIWFVSGPANIRSAERIAVNEWTTVSIERNRQEGTLVVNDGTPVKGYS